MNFSLDSRIAFLISLTRSPVFSCCSLRFFRTIIFNCLSRKSQLPVSWGHLLEVSCLAVAASASLMFVTPAALRRCLCRWRGPSFQARGTDSGEKKSSWEGGEHWSSRAGHRVETCGSCDSGSPWLSQPRAHVCPWPLSSPWNCGHLHSGSFARTFLHCPRCFLLSFKVSFCIWKKGLFCIPALQVTNPLSCV